MKKNLTELVFILDRSGSMHGLEADTIGGFNSMIDKQKKADGEAFVTTVLFDDECEIVHDRIDLKDIGPMTDKEYYVGGCTALVDALAMTIEHIKGIYKYAREEDVPEKTVFVITTDGYENASCKYTAAAVKGLIEEQGRLGWEFLFLGANIDAVETARTYGIDEDHAVDYISDEEGTQVNYEVLSDAIEHVRCCSAPLDSSWKAPIEADVKARRSRKRKK